MTLSSSYTLFFAEQRRPVFAGLWKYVVVALSSHMHKMHSSPVCVFVFCHNVVREKVSSYHVSHGREYCDGKFIDVPISKLGRLVLTHL